MLSVLVEKEQVALLATEAEQFLDRIDEEDPEEPGRAAARSTTADRSRRTSRCSARGSIGIGYDPERHLVLIELREDAADEDEPPPPLDESEGRVARLYATRAQVRAMVAHGAASVDAGRPQVPALRLPDGSRRAHLPALELTARRAGPTPAADDGALRDGEIEVARPDAVVVERDVPRER